MSKFVRNLVVGLLLCVASAPQVMAQFHPLPGSKSEQPVLCNGCPGANEAGQPNDGLPTYPYGGALKDHAGRYVDSTTTAQFQHLGFRTARAGLIRTAYDRRGAAPPRVYIAIGEAVGAYSLDTFFSTRLATLVPVSKLKTGSKVLGFNRAPETIALFDGFLYPEATAAQWRVPFSDGQTRLFDFDFDDRGYLYGAYSLFGWGIVQDDGRTDSTHFAKTVQLIHGGTNSPATYPNTLDDPQGVSSPTGIIAMKGGSKYYAAVTDGVRTTVIYDVTDPKKPKALSTRGTAILKWDRYEATGRVAILSSDGKVSISSYDDYPTGGAALATFSPVAGKFMDVSFDDSGNVWAIEDKGNLRKFSPAGSGYTTATYTPFPSTFAPAVMHAAAGHVVVAGIDRATDYDVRLLRVEANGPQNVNIDEFFRKYYHSAPVGFAEPSENTGLQADVQIVKWGGKTYLMYSVFGLGDVFEIEGSDSISVSMKNTFGTVNPNSKATSPGPYVGDIVTFSAASTGTSSFGVTWNFGNPEAGTPANQAGPVPTGTEVQHQYTALPTAAAITAPKLVRAVTIQDSSIATSLNVSLKVPTPRIGSSGLAAPVVSNTTGVDLVAGATFNDASDGSVESHYSVWTIDGVPTKLKPNQTIPVGGVGSHTAKLETFYGQYDASFAGIAPYAAPPVTLSYVVKPFKVALKAPTIVGSNVQFSATPTVTGDASVLTATQWNVEWTFTKGGSAAGALQSHGVESHPVGHIPPFDVPKSEVTPGSVVSLQITIDPAGLSLDAQQFNSVSVSSTLSTPDPAIDVTGCVNAGGPCKFTARSVGGGSTSDWTFAWTLKLNGSAIKAGTGNPYEPVVSAPGEYTISLKATKSVFDQTVDKNLTVAGVLCAPPPASHQVAITANGCGTSCVVGTQITFYPSFNGYTSQACDTYTWKMGDGTTKTGIEVTHSYASASNYTVTLEISNTSGSPKLVETKTVTVTSGGIDNPTCTTPANLNVTYGCTSGVNCRTDQAISFGVKRGSGNLQSCDSVSWEFSDGGTSSSKTPSRTFGTPGTYTATATVTNSKGSSSATASFVVVPPPTGDCSTAPGPGNFAITFTGAASGCTHGGVPCNTTETITFESPSYFYVTGACDNFEWDFGDNSAKSTQRTPQHVYATAGAFPVKLKVSNGAGSFTYTRTVNVQGVVNREPIPSIAPTTFPSTGKKGTAVTFTATSNMATTTGWTWNFGDGTAPDTSQAGAVSQTSTITHTFTKTGTFTVKATARNSTDVPAAPVGLAQGSIVVSEPPAIPEYRYLLPVTAHTAGLGGSAWRTDVQIYNPDPQVSEAKPLIMEASFKGVTYTLHMIKATHIYEDFLGMLLAQQKDDSGPVIITTKSATTPPQIWTRTYTQTAEGTFGQFIPAIRLDTAGGAGAVLEGKYYLSGLRHDNRYRTNVGFLNPNAAAITATVTVYDDRHLGIKQFTRSLQPFQLDQITLKSIVDNLPADRPFSIEIQVPDGQWLVAYASYIDGLSNDPIYLQAVRESDVAGADFKTAVIPGVGHTGAWRSDVTIFNPDSAGVVFDLQYFDNGGAKQGEAKGIVLDPYKFLQYDDVLKQGVLGNVPDGLGTLKIVATSLVPNTKYPMAFARTYNDDGANGTFGQGIGAFAAARPNVQPNKPAILAGVRNTTDYYTNIGLVNLSDAQVVATVTLLDPITGAASASIPYTLKPNESVVGQFNGFGSITSGTFKIEATGNVWAFASIIDKRTKDPEYVPARPLQ